MGTTPAKLVSIVDLFAGAPRDLCLEALLEYSRKLPPLPDRLVGHRDEMERVVECQSPFFLLSELEDDGSVSLWFDVPPEAPTTRGFAGILHSGLSGATPEEILATPDDFYDRMGLGQVISGLRLRGMSAILYRLKRQVRELAAARADRGAEGANARH